ncbi:hypothetical protein Y032_0044g1044 [Ancylostoma ceylanicum]|uniref:Uncharacterized protein n=1 Tax=Ancylostoma ceylanicum TaxID=53326 RepID=A0A016UF32_9BILA|nr:hypothetical protein Y032_0044g1044 [Ancylostoma ceylanicum]
MNSGDFGSCGRERINSSEDSGSTFRLKAGLSRAYSHPEHAFVKVTVILRNLDFIQSVCTLFPNRMESGGVLHLGFDWSAFKKEKKDEQKETTA